MQGVGSTKLEDHRSAGGEDPQAPSSCLTRPRKTDTTEILSPCSSLWKGRSGGRSGLDGGTLLPASRRLSREQEEGQEEGQAAHEGWMAEEENEELDTWTKNEEGEPLH